MKHLKILAAVAALCLVATLAQAQGEKPTRVRGDVAQLQGDVLTVKSRTGEMIPVHLTPNWTVLGVKAIGLDDIKAGDFIGTAAMPEAGGQFKAMEVLVFPEALRGTAEGHRPWDLAPESTMTNATVQAVVASSSNHQLTLTYKGGSAVINVPPSTPVVTFAPADKSMIVPGAHVVLFAVQADDGTISAPRVAVGLNGIMPPM